MYHKPFVQLIIVLAIAFVAGCGPSPEEIATMTAAAWTPTTMPTATPPPPTPTPTPTPIPFDLTVSVTDADGNPISGASVTIAELGEDEMAMQTSDESGQVAWSNLPGEMASLTVLGQGYFSGEQSQTIERGPNEVTTSLERDPFGVLPSEACAPGETPLLIEDFQDGKAQYWDQITAAIEFNAQNGWALVEDEPGNFVVTASQSANFADNNYYYEGMEPFDNAVWRLRTKFVGQDNDAFLNWRHRWNESGDWRYIVQYGGPVLLDLSRLHYEVGHFSVSGSSFGFREDQWYFFEIGTFDGVTEVWVDGEKKNSYEDPQPMGPGTIGLEVHLFEGSNSAYTFDNIVVCAITSPFDTIYISE
jgi:hypothetical protein